MSTISDQFELLTSFPKAQNELNKVMFNMSVARFLNHSFAFNSTCQTTVQRSDIVRRVNTRLSQTFDIQ